MGQQTDDFTKLQVARDKKYANAFGKSGRKRRETLGFSDGNGVIYAAMG
jgi:hypothetical protein